MYYPYLRGRQFELIALREFAEITEKKNNVIPIIEPVKKTFNSLKIAIKKFNAGNLTFSLILNPQVGEIVNVTEILDELKEDLTESTNWIPTFILLSDNYELISEIISKYNFSNVMVICSDVTDTSNNTFIDFINIEAIKYIVSKENRTLKRQISNLGKFLIRLDDNFIAQKRNKDYLTMPEEKFTEEHLYFESDGYHGFSDYTILGSDYKEGGAAPYAVCIHITYAKDNKEVWIRHFTSVSNDDTANIQGKFAESTKKAVNFLDSVNIKTNASQELRTYFKDQKYPGLGMVKKIMIKHHIELMNSIIVK